MTISLILAGLVFAAVLIVAYALNVTQAYVEEYNEE